MAGLDLQTIVLVCSSFLYALTLAYVIGLVLRPPLSAAIIGLIDLARLAVEQTDNRN